MSAGLSADWWQRDRHLPQAQEEEEGDEQRHHGDAVTQEVYDHSYLVVHLAFLLQGEKKKQKSTQDESSGCFHCTEKQHFTLGEKRLYRLKKKNPLLTVFHLYISCCAFFLFSIGDEFRDFRVDEKESGTVLKRQIINCVHY